MKTAVLSKSNHLVTAILGVLALAAPACVSDPGDLGAPGDPAAGDVGPDEFATKPAPVRPTTPPGDDPSAKPKHSNMPPGELSALVLTAGLGANPTNLWPTQFSTLTATASIDVGPTPYYLRIRENATGALLISCGTGSSCATSVTQPTDISVSYIATIEDFPGNVQAVSQVAVVNWFAASLNLATSATTLPVGGIATLTATASRDVGPSPFYIEIFDATTATRLQTCGSGISCGVSVSQAAATTHAYQAFLSPASGVFPPPGAQRVTAVDYVTWANSGLSVSLSNPVFTGTFTQQVTATASIDVGPTPYWIEIFDQTHGTRVAVCGFGTTCTATIPASTSSNVELVAFISANSTALPPDNAQAASNIVFSLFVIG